VPAGAPFGVSDAPLSLTVSVVPVDVDAVRPAETVAGTKAAAAATTAAARILIRTSALLCLCPVAGTYARRALVVSGGGHCSRGRHLEGDEVLIEHALDLRCARTPFQSSHHPPVGDQKQRRNRRDREAADEVGPRVRIDDPYAQSLALLVREVRYQALHTPRRPRPLGPEEHEHGGRVVVHLPPEIEFVPT